MKNEKNEMIFIVDDEPMWIELLKELLESLGYTNIMTFESGTACLENIRENPDIVFLDYQMEDKDGLSTLKGIKDYYTGICVIFTTATEDIAVAVNAMKEGSFDFLLKLNVTKKEIKTLFKKIRQNAMNIGKIL